MHKKMRLTILISLLAVIGLLQNRALAQTSTISCGSLTGIEKKFPCAPLTIGGMPEQPTGGTDAWDMFTTSLYPGTSGNGVNERFSAVANPAGSGVVVRNQNLMSDGENHTTVGTARDLPNGSTECSAFRWLWKNTTEFNPTGWSLIWQQQQTGSPIVAISVEESTKNWFFKSRNGADSGQNITLGPVQYGHWAHFVVCTHIADAPGGWTKVWYRNDAWPDVNASPTYQRSGHDTYQGETGHNTIGIYANHNGSNTSYYGYFDIYGRATTPQRAVALASNSNTTTGTTPTVTTSPTPIVTPTPTPTPLVTSTPTLPSPTPAPSVITTVTTSPTPTPNPTTCASLPTNNGLATTNVNIAASGTYTVWSRIMAGTNANSFWLQVDDKCPVLVGNSDSIPLNLWSWINYKNGSSTNVISMSLSAGTHSVKIATNEAGVKLDQVIFTSMAGCVPTGLGSNCIPTPTPTPQPSISPTPAPTPLPTPSPGTSPVTVTVTSPVAGQTYSQSLTATATATTSSGGEISRVDYYIDGVFGATALTAPYSVVFNISGLVNSSHSIYAKAFDTMGSIGNSEAVEFIVNNVVVPTPTPTANPTPTPTPMPTATPTPTPIPTPTPTPRPTATATPTPTPTPRPTVSPTPTTNPTNPPSTGGVWITQSEIMALPTSGTAWSNVVSWASRSIGTPTLNNQDSDQDQVALAKAYTCARIGEHCSEIITALNSLSSNAPSGDRTLAWGRNMTSWVIAADIVDNSGRGSGLNITQFKSWASRAILTNSSEGETIVQCHIRRPNNWSTMCGGARIAADLISGNTTDLQAAWNEYRGYVGDRSSGALYANTVVTTNWRCPGDSDRTFINPRGCTKFGENFDGILPAEMLRQGEYDGRTWPPSLGTYYPFNGLAGLVVQAELLYKNGFPAYTIADSALIRAYSWDIDEAHWNVNWASKAAWMPWVLNKRYTRSYPAALPATPGQNVGYVDWTHTR
jgi:hypothetical protein